MGIQDVVRCIKENNSFLITSHTNPEGDALGSELSFYRLISALGKTAVVINEDGLPYGYEFLPDTGVIRKFRKNMSVPPFDVFVTVDCSDLFRPGEVHTLNEKNKPVLNIDHHISNRLFGTVNWVKPEASCCAEMIFEIFKKMKVPIEKESALLIYVGILTDTGSFHYSNTTGFTHEVVAELMRYGIEPPRVYKNIYENIPFQDMRLLVDILPGMKTSQGGRVVWFQIKKELLRKHKKISFDLSEQILSFGRSIKGVEAVVLFKENLGEKDEVRVNFRSNGKIDVNKVASCFGGGGHRTASGCTIAGTIENTEKRVLREIRKAFLSL